MIAMPSQTMRSKTACASLAGALFLCSFLHAQNRKPAGKKESQAQSTREFLGLGKLPDAAAADRGSLIYSRNCAFCHGAKATGAEGPDLIRSVIVLHDEDGEQLGPFLHKGRPDRGMPAFPSFTSGQIKDIAAFLHQRVELTANRGTYKLLNIVTGDAEAGKTYFNGKGRCNECHAPTGDLAHIAAKYQPSELQSAFLYPASVGQSKPQTVTVTQPSGETVKGELKLLDDFDVALIDSNGNYRSWPRTNGLKVDMADPMAEHRALLNQYSDADMHNLLSYLTTLK